MKTIRIIYDELDTYNDKQREKYISALVKKLCAVSHTTLMKFQNEWNEEKTFEEFVVAQNKIIRECIDIETSSAGKDIREVMGLPEITKDTEIELEE